MDLHATDPEFVEYFDNWASGDVLADAAALDPTVDDRIRTMVQLAATIAVGALAEFRNLATAAVPGTVDPVELKEIVYQAVSYVGFARTSDFLQAANEVLTAQGIELPLPGQSTTDRENRLQRGLAVQKTIIGDENADRRYATAPADQLHVERYLSANCFGDTVGRAGLDLPTRELLTFAMLTALGGADAQVQGHVHGNLTVGNSRERLVAVVTVLLPSLGYPRSLNALAAINQVSGS
jgi:4-carboxymuconolactone decarboxylase